MGGPEAVGLDVGGTKIAGFRVDADGSVLASAVAPTEATNEAGDVLATMEDVARRVMSESVVAAGVGIAALIGHPAGVLRYAPNLPFRELPLQERLGRRLDLPVVVDNDANAAGWAEFRVGAGRHHDDMLLVTVGTGIGGAIVSGGRLLRGGHGFAGEIGHIIVEPGGPVCGCGNEGCWEMVASGRAIGRLGRAAAAGDPRSSLLAWTDGDVDRITGAVVTEAGLAGDHEAIGVLAEVGRRLGEGIAGLVNILDPEVVVVGGGAIVAGDLLLGPAREACARSVEAPDHRPEVPILAARLGNDAGGIGAALLALEDFGGAGAVPMARETG